MIGGALMGMVFVTHLALLLVYSPPAFLVTRAVESSVSKLITITTSVAFLTWNFFAILMAFAAEATQSSDLPAISIAPSPPYLFVVVFITVFLLIPGFVFFRDKKAHLIGEFAAFIAIFGFLIPNLVVAVQRS